MRRAQMSKLESYFYFSAPESILEDGKKKIRDGQFLISLLAREKNFVERYLKG